VDNTYPTEDYRTMRIEIPSGLQHMDGETTLRYVRSRHSSSDFDRARRQQQVLSALVRQFLAPGNWRRWPTAYTIAVDDFDTDLSVGDVVVLVSALLQVGPDGIEHLVIDHSFTTPWTTPSGGAVLLPRWRAIEPLVSDVFDS
jgi:anionic cell wall polymer biosynthesis LytR-Cps2A-Psr (LCP) family protein